MPPTSTLEPKEKPVSKRHLAGVSPGFSFSLKSHLIVVE
jgi:hypothetical protein